MEMAMKKQQEVVAAYKHKYKCMKGAWTTEKAQVAELTKITRCLMEDRKRMCTERDRLAAEHDKMAMRYSSMQQQNQALNATVANLQKEMKRLASYIHSNSNTNTHSGHAGHAGHSSMSTGTPSPYPPSSNVDPNHSNPPSHRHQMAQYVHHQRQHHQQQQQPQPQQEQQRHHQQGQQQIRMEGAAQIDYHLWQWIDVYRWLMSIENGRLRRYAGMLQVTLNQKHVDGSRLKSLNVQDLHGLGISNWKDQEVTMMHISNLQSHLGLESILDELDI